MTPNILKIYFCNFFYREHKPKRDSILISQSRLQNDLVSQYQFWNPTANNPLKDKRSATKLFVSVKDLLLHAQSATGAKGKILKWTQEIIHLFLLFIWHFSMQTPLVTQAPGGRWNIHSLTLLQAIHSQSLINVRVSCLVGISGEKAHKHRGSTSAKVSQDLILWLHLEK